MQPLKLIWAGELDSGSRADALVAGLESREPPAGVSVFLDEACCRIETSTRSAWAFLTWAVSALMIGLGLTTGNWFIWALSPFMILAAVMQTWGRVLIVARDGRLTVFEGLAGIGWRRRMPLHTMERVEYAVKRGRGGSTTWIVLTCAGRKMKFGRYLNDEQTQFVVAFLLDARRSLAP